MELKYRIALMRCNSVLIFKNVIIWKDENGKVTGSIYPKNGRKVVA